MENIEYDIKYIDLILGNVESIIIDDCAFCDFWNLKEIHLNRNLKRFGQAPFANCDNLKFVYYDGSKDEYERSLKANHLERLCFSLKNGERANYGNSI